MTTAPELPLSRSFSRNGAAPSAPRSKPQPTIHQILPRVMRDVGAIGKLQEHPQKHYRFRTLDDALNVIQPVLVKHRVSVSFNCFDHKVVAHRYADARGRARNVYRATLLLELTFWAPDGSCVTSTSAGEGQDECGDKATAKALSAAMKYGLFFGLLVPVGAEATVEAERPNDAA